MFIFALFFSQSFSLSFSSICPLRLDQKCAIKKECAVVMLRFLSEMKGYLNEMRRVLKTGNRIPLNSNRLSCLHTICWTLSIDNVYPLFQLARSLCRSRSVSCNSYGIRAMSHGNSNCQLIGNSLFMQILLWIEARFGCSTLQIVRIHHSVYTFCALFPLC